MLWPYSLHSRLPGFQCSVGVQSRRQGRRKHRAMPHRDSQRAPPEASTLASPAPCRSMHPQRLATLARRRPGSQSSQPSRPTWPPSTAECSRRRARRRRALSEVPKCCASSQPCRQALLSSARPGTSLLVRPQLTSPSRPVNVVNATGFATSQRQLRADIGAAATRGGESGKASNESGESSNRRACRDKGRAQLARILHAAVPPGSAHRPQCLPGAAANRSLPTGGAPLLPGRRCRGAGVAEPTRAGGTCAACAAESDREPES